MVELLYSDKHIPSNTKRCNPKVPEEADQETDQNHKKINEGSKDIEEI